VADGRATSHGKGRPSRRALHVPPSVLRALEGLQVRLVQRQGIGYDGVTDQLPRGVRFGNAAGIHAASTAELALGLMIAAQRRLPDHVRAQSRGEWAHYSSRALIDFLVLVLGQGGVGRAINARLAPFETSVIRVATIHREDADGPIHGLGELPALLGEADIVTLAIPLTEGTTGMVDRSFLNP
jgi:phosphoglycerate dehydrogenase-like enzyme